MVFEKDSRTPVCNEILYGRAGYLYSILLVKKFVSDVTEDTFIKQVNFLHKVDAKEVLLSTHSEEPICENFVKIWSIRIVLVDINRCI